MAYCLSAANLLLEAVDRIAMGWNCLKYPWRMARNFGSAYLKHRGRERRAYHEHAGNGSIFSAAEALLEYHPARTREKIAQGLRAAGGRRRPAPGPEGDRRGAGARKGRRRRCGSSRRVPGRGRGRIRRSSRRTNGCRGA